MVKNGEKVDVFKCISSPNGWPNRGNQQEFREFIMLSFADHVTSWDMVLPHVEFAFNKFVNKSIGCALFEMVYGF